MLTNGFYFMFRYNNYLALRLRSEGRGGKEKTVIAKTGLLVLINIQGTGWEREGFEDQSGSKRRFGHRLGQNFISYITTVLLVYKIISIF